MILPAPKSILRFVSCPESILPSDRSQVNVGRRKAFQDDFGRSGRDVGHRVLRDCSEGHSRPSECHLFMPSCRRVLPSSILRNGLPIGDLPSSIHARTDDWDLRRGSDKQDASRRRRRFNSISPTMPWRRHVHDWLEDDDARVLLIGPRGQTQGPTMWCPLIHGTDTRRCLSLILCISAIC